MAGGFVVRSEANAEDLVHSRWDALLHAYVTPESRVRYRGWKEHGLAELDAYLHTLTCKWPEGMQPDETKAALINSYNALRFAGF